MTAETTTFLHRRIPNQGTQPTRRLRTTDILTEFLHGCCRRSGAPPLALRVPRVYLPYTWRGTAQVSALMYLAANGRRTARREGVAPGGTRRPTGRRYGRYTAGTTCRRPRAGAGRALRGAGRGLRAGAGVAGGVRGGCRGGGGEPVAAGLVGDHLRGAEGGELVQGVGDRAGRPLQHLADLVRGEDRVRGTCAGAPRPGRAGRRAGSRGRAGRWRRP